MPKSFYFLKVIFLYTILFNITETLPIKHTLRKSNHQENYLQLFHPFLKNIKLTKEMKSLLYNARKRRSYNKGDNTYTADGNDKNNLLIVIPKDSPTTTESNIKVLSMSEEKLKTFLLENLFRNPYNLNKLTTLALRDVELTSTSSVTIQTTLTSSSNQRPFTLNQEMYIKFLNMLQPLEINKHDGIKSTTQANTETIEEILKNLEEIREMEAGNRKKEGLPCKVTGLWLSSAGGVLINITNSFKTLHVSVHDKSPPSSNGFLSTDWKMHGTAPFPKYGLLMLTGSDEATKQTVTFSGECRVCNGRESISGMWMLGRIARDCNDQRTSIQILGDIWRRETLTELRQKRLKYLYKPKTTSTAFGSLTQTWQSNTVSSSTESLSYGMHESTFKSYFDNDDQDYEYNLLSDYLNEQKLKPASKHSLKRKKTRRFYNTINNFKTTTNKFKAKLLSNKSSSLNVLPVSKTTAFPNKIKFNNVTVVGKNAPSIKNKLLRCSHFNESVIQCVPAKIKTILISNPTTKKSLK